MKKPREFWLQDCAHTCEGVFYGWNKPREFASHHVIEKKALDIAVEALKFYATGKHNPAGEIRETGAVALQALRKLGIK